MNYRTVICNVSTILFFNVYIFGQSADTKIKTFLDDLKSTEFSGAVLVANKDRITEHRSFGLASKEHGIGNKLDTKFNIASITKMITAVGILQLYESGEVELNEPVGKYLPDYPNKVLRDSVTIHQLLTHTSGNNNFYVENFLVTDKSKYRTISDFVSLFANAPLLSRPGTKYDYSASGYVILGLIIEKVSGKNYYDYLKSNIFARAEMKNTTELEIDSIVKNKASGYTTLFGEIDYAKKNDYYLSKASPAGFHYSTVEDLFKFSRALRNGTLLQKETAELMFTPKVKGYSTNIGYGIDVDMRYNQIIQGHSGGWYGVRGELMDFMKDHYTVVILSNMDDNGKTGASMVADFFKMLIAGKQKEK
ncbi:serine hydrolase domain-containing protein [Zobellia uliginosa]|uniref:serine hydrolase domain-containing protein n=1 Tax=Zobellia uliginosa TaxID=143224 RepID=UPI0026E2661C|nr:serine hydrolase domain-containing protein [Zobellia uliginosa]MDO6517803.1 serine hydrolase domain-containing protein [Zobellia uliginosa]